MNRIKKIPGNGNACICIRAAVILYLLVTQVIAQYDPLKEENDFYREKGYVLLSGEQYGDYETNVYLVTEDVIVEKGKTLTFFPGTVVLFKKNTRICVKGNLICQGNKEGSVTLKKLDNDKYFYKLEPELPALWHGIEAAESAQLEISFTYIMNSKSGIAANAAFKLIILDTVKFSGNKYHNLKIGDSVVSVPDDKFISFNSEVKPYKVVLCSKEKEGGKKKERNWKIPVRIILGSTVLAGAVVSGIFHYRANDYKKQYEESTVTAETDRLREETVRNRLIGNIGIGVSAAGAVGFVVTIPLGKKGERQ